MTPKIIIFNYVRRSARYSYNLSNIENGHSKLSLPMAVALANVLSVSVDEFLCDSVIHSKEVFSHEVQMLLEDCDDYEIRILTDSKQPNTRSAGI